MKQIRLRDGAFQADELGRLQLTEPDECCCDNEFPSDCNFLGCASCPSTMTITASGINLPALDDFVDICDFPSGAIAVIGCGGRTTAYFGGGVASSQCSAGTDVRAEISCGLILIAPGVFERRWSAQITIECECDIGAGSATGPGRVTLVATKKGFSDPSCVPTGAYTVISTNVFTGVGGGVPVVFDRDAFTGPSTIMVSL